MYPLHQIHLWGSVYFPKTAELVGCSTVQVAVWWFEASNPMYVLAQMKNCCMLVLGTSSSVGIPKMLAVPASATCQHLLIQV